MRHSAPRSRVRWRRFLVAGLSSLTVAASLLGAAGAFTFSPEPDRTQVSDDPAAGTRTVAERAFDTDAAKVEEKAPAPDAESPKSSKSSTSSAPAPDDVESTTPADEAEPTARAQPTKGSEQAELPTDPKKEPVSFVDQPLDLPPDSGSGRRVVFSITKQYVWLVAADDSIERRYPVSGSRFDQVEPGNYEVIRTRRHTTSWHGTESMEYMVTFTFGENAAIGFHDIPRSLDTGDLIQTLDELGMALSDGCIRQRHKDAAALWDFAPVDTPVIVLA